MALIRCKECGREISEFSTKCPHCGYSFGEMAVGYIGAGCLVVLVALILMSLAF